jgi:hypothetical protein
MINYSSYNDVWGITLDTSQNKLENYNNLNQENQENQENKVNNNKIITNYNSDCDIMDHILNCPKCLKKLKKKLQMKENYQKNDNNKLQESFSNLITNKISSFNTKIKNILLLFCDNKQKKYLVLILLIIIFIILSFEIIKGRGTETKATDIEALSEAVSSSNMKFLKENFVMIPKSMMKTSINPSLLL